MSAPIDSKPKAGLADYLAAERTFLAWIRTGLALMGFGFVVARFGLFLQQMRAIEQARLGEKYGLSLWFGTALIAVGVIVNLFGGWRHARLVRQLDLGEAARPYPLAQIVTIAWFLALVGVAMTIYLLLLRPSASAQSLGTAPSSRSQEESMATIMDNGIANKASHHSVDETVEKLKGILKAKGVTLFALVDHSGEAEKAGMKMPPTKLLIFGSPKAGTPVMLAAPSSAIDLPLKILVWEDGQGKVWVSYNRPDYLQKRHGIPPDLLTNIAVVEALAEKAAE
jgi:uncharacterized protein (DUF302 family)/uncharacterized membrane protein YidH (DUF202 family)